MPLSEYVRSMNEEEKTQYFVKLRQLGFVNEDDDPFLIDQSLSKKLLVKWSSSIESWPELEFGNMYVYLIECPGYSRESLKSYKSLDAYKFFANGWVNQLYIRHSYTGHCIARANVNRCQDLNDEPYKAWVGFDNDDGSIITGHCSCMDGSVSVCSHVVAIMFQVEAATRLGFKNKTCCNCPCQCYRQTDEGILANIPSSSSVGAIKTRTAVGIKRTRSKQDTAHSSGFHKYTSSEPIIDMINKKRPGRKPKRQVTSKIPAVHSEISRRPKQLKGRRKRKTVQVKHSKVIKPEHVNNAREDLEDGEELDSCPSPAASPQVEKHEAETPEGQPAESFSELDAEENADVKLPVKIEEMTVPQTLVDDIQTKSGVETRKQSQDDYSCHVCKSTFSTSALLERHMEKEHTAEYKKIMKDYQRLLNHKRPKNCATIVVNSTDKRPFPCSECEKSFNYISDLQKHLRQHTGEKPFKCDECSKSYRNSSDYYRHKRTHTGIKPHKCNECEKSFGDRSSLQRHKRTHTGEKPYQCIECLKTFTDSSHLHAHKRTHTGEKPFQCKECGKCYGNGSSLQTHMRKHTGERPYKCGMCDRSFGNISYLRVHRRRHTGEKPYLCNECGKSFFNSSDLSRHMKLHTGEYSFVCAECGKGFSNSTHLNAHMGRHTGVRPFKCTECDKSFCYGSDLKAHMRKHTGEKPFKCLECGKGFAQSSDRYRHMRTHTGEKHFKCKECGKSYTDNGSLHRHIKKTHRQVNAFDVSVANSELVLNQTPLVNSFVACGMSASQYPQGVFHTYNESADNSSFLPEQPPVVNSYSRDVLSNISKHPQDLDPYGDAMIDSTHPVEHVQRVMSYGDNVMNDNSIHDVSGHAGAVNMYSEVVVASTLVSDHG